MMNKNALNTLIELVRKKKLNIGFAESCTGGKLSAQLAETPGVSDIFKGSIVSYANQVKEDLLGVSRNTLMNEGAVSDEVARQMAHGARNQLKTDWSVAITGVAGPSGGSAEKPVGTVYFAVAGPNFVDSRKKLFSGDRKAIQQASVEYAIGYLTETINNN